jgi:acetyltransferase-like isoleucine patch superfamily enzyme
MRWSQAWRHACRHPKAAVGVLAMLVRGWYYRVRYRVTGNRVVFGRNFRVSGRLDIRGAGRVIFGDDCLILGSRLAPVTPYTHAPEATIEIGPRVVLNGTRFGCAERIEIAEGCVLADARLMDTDFHAVEIHGGHRWRTTGRTKAIRLGPHVWVGAGAFILKGVSIGAHTVVGAGAVVTRDLPPFVMAAGNPARVVKELRREET